MKDDLELELDKARAVIHALTVAAEAAQFAAKDQRRRAEKAERERDSLRAKLKAARDALELIARGPEPCRGIALAALGEAPRGETGGERPVSLSVSSPGGPGPSERAMPADGGGVRARDWDDHTIALTFCTALDAMAYCSAPDCHSKAGCHIHKPATVTALYKAFGLRGNCPNPRCDHGYVHIPGANSETCHVCKGTCIAPGPTSTMLGGDGRPGCAVTFIPSPPSAAPRPAGGEGEAGAMVTCEKGHEFDPEKFFLGCPFCNSTSF